METKNYLVIGGTKGIGAAIVEQLANESHKVYVWARSENETTLNAHVIFTINDATSSTYDTSALPEVLHGLVYCPGSINLKPFHRLTDADFLNDLHINLLGAIRTTQTVLPLLKKSSNASIVYFSTVAVSMGMGFHTSIASAKGAVEGLTKSLAAELAPGIRVNAIAPSLTATPLAEKLLATEEKQDAAKKRHPLQRYGNAAHIASLACFLLSHKSEFITGQIMHADGGLSSISK